MYVSFDSIQERENFLEQLFDGRADPKKFDEVKLSLSGKNVLVVTCYNHSVSPPDIRTFRLSVTG